MTVKHLYFIFSTRNIIGHRNKFFCIVVSWINIRRVDIYRSDSCVLEIVYYNCSIFGKNSKEHSYTVSMLTILYFTILKHWYYIPFHSILFKELMFNFKFNILVFAVSRPCNSDNSTLNLYVRNQLLCSKNKIKYYICCMIS